MNSGGINLQFNEEATQLADEAPNAANLRATGILDCSEPSISGLATEFRRQHRQGRDLLQAVHRPLVEVVKPVYTLDELQPASHTLRKRMGSCRQRMACLEALSRTAGIATRSRALCVSGRFWYPRFRVLSMFIPRSILLLWPQFYFDGAWVDFDDLYGSPEDLAGRADHGFLNDGESVFDAVAPTPVDFLAKTCRAGCSAGAIFPASCWKMKASSIRGMKYSNASAPCRTQSGGASLRFCSEAVRARSTFAFRRCSALH